MDERAVLKQLLDLSAAQRETDRAQRIRCQRGDHDMLSTASPGVVVCRLCRVVGVCLWCGMTLPQDACVLPCPTHTDLVAWQARHSQPAAKRHQEGEQP